MEEITIYEFQLKTIIEALRLTKKIYVDNKDSGETCYDRQVKQAYLFAENALKGGKDKRVEYIDNTYIICSAIWFNDGKQHKHQPKNIEQGFVLTGRRHHNCFSSFQSIGKALGYDKTSVVKKGIPLEEREIQGFITNTNLFVDRNKAGKIAFLAGQTKELKTKLFSEDLY